MKIIVLGAGIIGITTAYYLSRSGHQVQVIEQATGPARGCSYANGGQLSYSYTEPLATPHLATQLPSLSWRRDSPLTIRVSAVPGLVKWGSAFLRSCTSATAATTTEDVLRLALYSREMLHRVINREQLEFDYRQTGKLHIYSDLRSFVKTRHRVDLKNRLGCEQQILDGPGCLAKEPALESLKGQIVGGVFSPLDESGDSYALARSLATISESSGGVQFNYGRKILKLDVQGQQLIGVRTDQGTYEGDAYILCTGATSPELSRMIGFNLPIYPVKGYSLTVPAAPRAPTVNITDTKFKLVYTTLGDRLRIAGMMEFNGYDNNKNEKILSRMLSVARRRFPEAGHYDQSVLTWTGLRPMTPDSTPIIGRSRYKNLFLNTGHGMLGSTLAFGSASVLADIVNGKQPETNLTGSRGYFIHS
jgi:D-amino-acid dehydrogenase